jgi:hypothetical protein
MHPPPSQPSAFAAPAGAHLTYYGGRVVSNLQVVQVLYGTGSYLSQVSSTTSPSLATFYQGVLNSPYVDWLTEYNTTTQVGPRSNQIIGRGTFAGQYAITPSSANNRSTISDSNIQSELAAQITAGHLPAPTSDAAGNPNTYYAIFFPHGKTISLGGVRSCAAGGFCAYHGTIANVPGFGEVYYGVHPDMQAGSGCDTGCGNAATAFGNYTSVASHEMVETITDCEVGIASVDAPPLAWYDDANGEIGDICNAQQGTIVGGDGVTYTVQLEFSNTADACIVSKAPNATPTATPTPVNTPTPTATAPPPTVVLNPLSGPILVGGTVGLTGQGFTAGSVVVLFVATSSGALQLGPYVPASHTATALSWNVPIAVPLANGFATVQVVNTDEGFIASDVQAALLQGAAAAGLPAITALNGVALSPADPSVPLANVSTAIAQNAALTVTGTGFNNPIVALYSSNPTAAALEPLAGGSSTQLVVMVPAGIPTGPGALQVLNRPSFAGSSVVSVPIGARIRIDSVTQSGTTVTVAGAGFSALTVISFFNAQKGGVVNLGGLLNGTQSLIPLSLMSSQQFTFQIPSGAVSGPAYVQALNPPFIPFTSTGDSPNGAITIAVP